MAQIKWRDLNRVRKSKWSKQCKHARHLKNKLNGLKQIKWQLNSKRKALLKIHKCKRNLTEESERSNVLQCTAKKPGSWNRKLTLNCIIWRSKVLKSIVTRGVTVHKTPGSVRTSVLVRFIFGTVRKQNARYKCASCS